MRSELRLGRLGRIGTVMLLAVALLAVRGSVARTHAVAAGGWGGGGPGFALADATNECGGGPAVATASTFECDYRTTAPIPNGAGADFTLTITAPAGTVFASFLGSTPALPAGCTTAIAANVFTISNCAGGPLA